MINILCHTPFTLLPSIKFGKIEMRLFKVFILLSYAIFTGSVFAQTSIELVKVAGNLNKPLAMVQPTGDSRLFIIEQDGLIKILENGIITGIFLDLSKKIVKLNKDYDERGLLGLAFHPDFKNNGRFFVAYSAPIEQYKSTVIQGDYSHVNAIEEFTAASRTPGLVNPDSGKLIQALPWPHFNHNGHWIGFGPDHKLYIATGDGGYANEWAPASKAHNYNSQKLDNYFGKILRLDIDQKIEGKSYTIPPDNPVIKITGALPEIWSFGLRDPWRCSFDQAGSQRLFCGDVQQDSFEAVKIIVKGENMGWPVVEGRMHCFNWESPRAHGLDCDKTGINPAIIEYPNCTAVPAGCKGISVTGGFVNRGSNPKLQGKYIFGDWSKRFDQNDGQIFLATASSGGEWSMESPQVSMQNMPPNKKLPFVLAFAKDSKGEVYVLTELHRNRNVYFEDAIYMI